MGHSRLPLLFLCWTMYTASGQDLWSNLISRVPEGVPGVDYPNYTTVPKRTSFNCRDRKPGFYADPETQCQGWHWCDTFLIKHSFLCANMTVFNQKIRGCDWWYNVDCNLAVSQYINNDELYRPSPAEEARQGKKVTQASSEGRLFGASASVPSFAVTNPATEPQVLDYDDQFFSATAAPTTRVAFSASSFPATSPVVSTNPSTRGVLRVRPTTRILPPPLPPTDAGVDSNRADFPIAFPPLRVGPPSSTTFDFDAALAAVTGVASLNTLSTPTIAGFPSVASTSASIPPIPVVRRRPTRVRTPPGVVATFVPSSEPSTPSVVARAPTSTFTFATADVDNTFLAHAPTRPDTDTSATSGSLFETTLDGRDAPTSLLDGRTGNTFLDVLDVSTASTFQNELLDTEPPGTPEGAAIVATRPAPSFAPFPVRTTQKILTFSPTFGRQSPTTTSGATTRFPERTTNPFDFGIPFGARIAPAASDDNLVTVRRSDESLGSPSTTLAETFPSTPKPSTTTLVTPKPTKPVKSTTAEASSTTQRRTFPSFPITTFKPSTTLDFLTRSTVDGTFGDRDVNAVDTSATEAVNATTLSLVEDLPVSR